jgi:phosphoserine aminotransferase
MLAVEDAVDGLKWAESIGGLDGLLARTRANFAAIERWVAATPWIEFLAEDPATRSTTSVCLVFADAWFRGLALDAQAKAAKDVAARLEAEGVALDIGSYRDAPAGLRLWAGATVETSDIEALLPWIDWAYGEVRPA